MTTTETPQKLSKNKRRKLRRYGKDNCKIAGNSDNIPSSFPFERMSNKTEQYSRMTRTKRRKHGMY
jgi:hypothetical protein